MPAGPPPAMQQRGRSGSGLKPASVAWEPGPRKLAATPAAAGPTHFYLVVVPAPGTVVDVIELVSGMLDVGVVALGVEPPTTKAEEVAGWGATAAGAGAGAGAGVGSSLRPQADSINTEALNAATTAARWSWVDRMGISFKSSKNVKGSQTLPQPTV
jgi:hypothetical protein